MRRILLTIAVLALHAVGAHAQAPVLTWDMNSAFIAGSSVGTTIGPLVTSLAPAGTNFVGTYSLATGGTTCPSTNNNASFSISGSNILLASGSTTVGGGSGPGPDHPYVACVAATENGTTSYSPVYFKAVNTSTLAANCPANTQCVENTRTGTTYTGSGFIKTAINATESGDTLAFQWPAPTYTEHDIQDTMPFPITLNLNGAVFDPSIVFNGTGGVGTVSQFVFGAGAEGATANLTVENGTIQNVTQSYNTNTTSGSCNGVTIAPGAPTICNGGCNAAAFWFFDGTENIVNMQIYHDCNGTVGNPGVFQSGTIEIEDSYFAELGTGIGQAHCIYAGPVNSVTIIGTVATHCDNGHAFKIRGVTNLIQGNSGGDANELANPAPIGTIAGNTDYSPTSNEVNDQDGGTTTLSGNTWYKNSASAGLGNAFFIEYGGQAAPHHGGSFSETGDTFVFADGYTGSSGQYVEWDAFDGMSFSSTDNTVEGSPGYSGWLLGEGSQSSNGNFASSTLTTYPIVTGNTLTPLENYQGTNGAQSWTISANTNTAVLGGNGLLTVTLPSGGGIGGTEVYPGLGGATVSGPAGTSTNFIDLPGGTPASSTYNGQTVNTVDLRTNGDVVNGGGVNGGYYIFEGAGQTLNVTQTPENSYVYQVYNGATPPTLTVNGNAGGCCLVTAGGLVTINGTGTGVTNFVNSAAPGFAATPACVQFNYTSSSGAPPTGLFCSQGMQGNTLQFDDYTNPSTHSWFNPTGSAVWNLFMTNGTIYFGNSTAAEGGGFTSVNYVAANYSNLRTAVVVGTSPTGSQQFGPNNEPSLFEVAKGFSGGKVTLNNFSVANGANSPIVFLGGASEANCSIVTGGNYSTTVTASDGSVIYMPYGNAICDQLDFTPPSGWNDATLTGSNISGTSGTTVAAPVTLTDAVARTLSGYEEITVSDSGGKINMSCPNFNCIFNVGGTITYGGSASAASVGGSISMIGDEVSVEKTLAAMTDTLGSNGTISVQEWNEGGFKQTLTLTSTVSSGAASTSVACAPGTLTAPLTAGQLVCPITVQPSGWTGSLSLSGTNAAEFSVNGSNLVTSSTPPPAGSAQVTITATP